MPTDALININGESVQTLEILFVTTFLALLPTLLVMMTCFTRYVIVVSFLRTAMGTQSVPPNMVLIGIVVSLTLYTMAPIIEEIQVTAYTPYVNEEISQEEFLELAVVPLKKFMITQTAPETRDLYCEMAGVTVNQQDLLDIPLLVIVVAFATSELKTAFEMGFLISIPFVLVDMVIAATLMSMGMMMLPPSLISLPFKLLLFVVLDGWNLVFTHLVMSVK